MSIFDGKRIASSTFKLDIQRMRRGWYSDKYFENIMKMLTVLSKEGFTLPYPVGNGVTEEEIFIGDLEVEMQIFNRRPGMTVIVGVDKALAMLLHCTGHLEENTFVDTWKNLDVWAVQDGSTVNYNGDPTQVQPVLRVRGRYRDFALLETPMLGILTRSSRIATNVYETQVAARGKPLLFFPARFDMHEVQAADGYAYNIAVQRFNQDYAKRIGPFISTDAQGDWWGGAGGGTVAHAAIACFMGDTAGANLAFSRTMPPEIPRIALVDFNNDCVNDSIAVCDAMFARYRELTENGDHAEAKKYLLYGVRLDTGASIRDISVPPLGDADLDLGVTPRLVFLVRQALDGAWQRWNLNKEWEEKARQFCRNVKIVVSGGFNPEKIRRFEKLGVPVDIYAVGSSLFDNHGPTVTDFTADIVRIKVDGKWIDMAKVGRAPCDNPNLEKISAYE